MSPRAHQTPPDELWGIFNPDDELVRIVTVCLQLHSGESARPLTPGTYLVTQPLPWSEMNPQRVVIHGDGRVYMPDVSDWPHPKPPPYAADDEGNEKPLPVSENSMADAESRWITVEIGIRVEDGASVEDAGRDACHAITALLGPDPDGLGYGHLRETLKIAVILARLGMPMAYAPPCDEALVVPRDDNQKENPHEH